MDIFKVKQTHFNTLFFAKLAALNPSIKKYRYKLNYKRLWKFLKNILYKKFRITA